MCQSRLLTNLSGSHREFPLAGDGAGQNLRAFSFFGRRGFACDHTFVHIGGIGGHETLGFDYITIHGHLLAWSHFEQIALLDGRNGHFAHDGRFDDVAGCIALGLLLNDMCGLGCHAHQLADGTCRTVFRLLFEQTSGEHKGENHHRSVEVGVPFDVSAAPDGFAEKCVECAEKEGNARRERHECVHTRSSISHLLPRIMVEGPSADHHAKQRQHERNDIVRKEGPCVNPSHRKAHHQHGQHPSQQRLAKQCLALSLFNLCHVAVLFDDEVVADVVHLALHLFERDYFGVELHQRRASGQ